MVDHQYYDHKFICTSSVLIPYLTSLETFINIFQNKTQSQSPILNALIEHYSVVGIKPSILRMECLKIQMADIQPKPASTPNIMKIMDLKRTIAPTSCEAESSFSTMNRLKTAKRSKLSDGRTNDLVLLSHEKVLMKAIDIG